MIMRAKTKKAKQIAEMVLSLIELRYDDPEMKDRARRRDHAKFLKDLFLRTLNEKYPSEPNATT